jgi:hypothetical protein
MCAGRARCLEDVEDDEHRDQWDGRWERQRDGNGSGTGSEAVSDREMSEVKSDSNFTSRQIEQAERNRSELIILQHTKSPIEIIQHRQGMRWLLEHNAGNESFFDC